MRALRFIAVQLCLIILISSAAMAQKSFEGTVDLKYTGERGDNTIRYFTKNGMVRIEMGENAKVDSKAPKTGTMIVKNKNLLMLMPDRKAYIERPLDLSKSVRKFDQKADAAHNFTNTGETKHILGYSAEKWTLNDEKGQLEVWSTKDLGNFVSPDGIAGLSRNTLPEWQQRILSEGFFPLLVIQLDRDGKEINRLEVTNIDKATPSDDLFNIPQGFTKLDMPHGNMHKQDNQTGNK